MKMAITSPKKSPNSKILVHTVINIFLEHLFNPKSPKYGTRVKRKFKTCINRPIFCIKKIKIAFSQKFSKVGFHSFFLWLPMYQTNSAHWQSSWNRTGVVGGMHGWREALFYRVTSPKIPLWPFRDLFSIISRTKIGAEDWKIIPFCHPAFAHLIHDMCVQHEWEMWSDNPVSGWVWRGRLFSPGV